jgi:hypothetical protein
MPWKEVPWMVGMMMLKASPFLPVDAFHSISYWPMLTFLKYLMLVNVIAWLLLPTFL